MTLLTDVTTELTYEGNNVFGSQIKGVVANTSPAVCDHCGKELEIATVLLSDTLGDDDKSEVPGTGSVYPLNVHRCEQCDPTPLRGHFRLVTKPSNDDVIFVGSETMRYLLVYPYRDTQTS